MAWNVLTLKTKMAYQPPAESLNFPKLINFIFNGGGADQNLV